MKVFKTCMISLFWQLRIPVVTASTINLNNIIMNKLCFVFQYKIYLFFKLFVAFMISHGRKAYQKIKIQH